MSEHQSDPISDDELDPNHPYNVPAVARTDIHGQPIPESAPSDVGGSFVRPARIGRSRFVPHGERL